MPRFFQRLSVFIFLSVGTAFAQEEPAQISSDAVDSAETGADVKAEEGGETAGGQPGAEVIYIPFKPPLVVNYGGVGRLRYLKADIALRLDSAKAADAVRHHMPYLRNNLVMLFSAQTDESLSSQEGKEALRQEALREVREVLLAEAQQAGVVDLYFNSFVVQN